jgi:uncharacterized protein (TIGR02246 family)
MSHPSAFEDRFAIRELIDQYSDAVNERDWAAFASCFTEDAVWDVGAPFSFKLETRDLITQIASSKISEEEYVIQCPHAPVIKLNGDTATARTTMHEVVRSPGNKGAQLMGTYYDDLVRTPEGWRFKVRTFRVTYFDPQPPVGDVFKVFAKPA